MDVVADRRSPVPADESPHHEQHPLWLSVLLHLGPGAVLTAFIVVAAAAFGMEPLLALLVGILVVLAPLELGYLALHAKRTTGSWSPLGAVDYRAKVPWKRLGLIGVGLAAWMIVLVAVGIAFLDEWLAGSVFAWLPETILVMASVGGDEEVLSTGALIGFLALFFVTNGVVGPVTEEMYFRGHLLPRIDRFGRGAPVLNTAFSARRVEQALVLAAEVLDRVDLGVVEHRRDLVEAHAKAAVGQDPLEPLEVAWS